MVSTINRTDRQPLTMVRQLPAARTATLLFRRAAEALLTAWTAVTITFFALRLTGGDPTASLLSQGLASAEQLESLRNSLHLDQPLPIQYGQFLLNLFQGDLGVSFYTGRSVFDSIAEQIQPSLALGLVSTLFMLFFAALLGTTAAYRFDKPAGRFASWLADMLTTLPAALIGLLFLYLFSLLRQQSGLFSTFFSGRGYSLLLPSLVLGLSLSGAAARILKTSLLEVLREPYVLAARARGMDRGGRLLWFTLRPALPPVIALSAIEIAYIFSGTVITENIFARPGLGRLLVSSILQGDFPVAQGVIILAALFYTGSHFLAETISMLLDPRLRGRS